MRLGKNQETARAEQSEIECGPRQVNTKAEYEKYNRLI